jgi:hypothetical protein
MSKAPALQGEVEPSTRILGGKIPAKGPSPKGKALRTYFYLYLLIKQVPGEPGSKSPSGGLPDFLSPGGVERIGEHYVVPTKVRLGFENIKFSRTLCLADTMSISLVTAYK